MGLNKEVFMMRQLRCGEVLMQKEPLKTYLLPDTNNFSEHYPSLFERVALWFAPKIIVKTDLGALITIKRLFGIIYITKIEEPKLPT